MKPFKGEVVEAKVSNVNKVRLRPSASNAKSSDGILCRCRPSASVRLLSRECLSLSLPLPPVTALQVKCKPPFVMKNKHRDNITHKGC